ncbi:ABC transporter ATP-binding protein [Alkalimarinus alittae]|uniref:ATP-binding cassette domain-containing protein n=1 Tax=Alkalimarinus alittae TaxID=2961619 RepID=A0ABY6N4Y7_9ALTE|nr:ATP-binding cassette domain-containing protein [Alkalimarinus alittae]UZE97057.1 ATP-binding cassette domain-containing protein [Alkalimarinus alittae]
MAQLTQTSSLEVSRLNHRFGPAEILRDINFSVQKGQVVSIVGPSGGGKTTLLHLCAGLLDVLDGDIKNTFESFSFAFQDARLLPWQTTLDNIAFGLKAKGVKKALRHTQAKEIALRFGLDEADFNKFPKDLSGGMRQRVAFARALVVQPELLYLDEPFSALDIGLKQELQSILIELVNLQSLSILFITHDLMEAVKLSHQILLLDIDPGRIVERFTLNKPLPERDDQFVYQETARLLAHPKIRQTFELNLRAK